MGTMCYASHWGEGKLCSKGGRLNGEALCFESTLRTTMEKHPRASISIKLSQTNDNTRFEHYLWKVPWESKWVGIWQRPRWKIVFLVKRLIFTRKLNHSICQLCLLCFSVFLGEVLGFGPGSAEIRSNSLWREWSEGHGVGQAQTEKFHSSLGLITFFYYYLLYFVCVCVCSLICLYVLPNREIKYFFCNCFMYLYIFFFILHLRPDSAPLSTLAGNFDSVHEQAHTNQWPWV